MSKNTSQRKCVFSSIILAKSRKVTNIFSMTCFSILFWHLILENNILPWRYDRLPSGDEILHSPLQVCATTVLRKIMKNRPCKNRIFMIFCYITKQQIYYGSQNICLMFLDQIRAMVWRFKWRWTNPKSYTETISKSRTK